MRKSCADRSAVGATGWLVWALAAVVMGLAGGGVPDGVAASSSMADGSMLAQESGGADPSLEVPAKVYEILGEILRLQGNPPPGYAGGRPFMNRERRLPRGRYREYDVNPAVPGQNRGPERLVIEQRSGRAYYTKDHYRSFVPVN